ncbi:hypothetical protein CsSME_00018419 [Camellia sinensis var. sinensis]
MANEGGWKPVFRRRQGMKGPLARLHTIFVDEIPESMTRKGLYTMFSNFGIVKDVYILEKRRKATRTKFEFVRYDCPVAAGVAIQKANGVWCGNRILKVKRADFERDKEPTYPRAIVQKPVGILTLARVDVGGRSSYVEALKGGMNGSGTNIRIKVEEYATGWLQMSVVTKVKTHCSFADLKADCQLRGLKDIQIREGGGRNVLITFKSKEDMMQFMHSSGDWIMEWCESIIEWHKGVRLDNERVVWVRCFGVPPHLWNANNFRKIGEGCGVVVEMDHNVLSMELLKCMKV